ncbi:MAG: hypothetical protein KatS3mg124_0782 [Porticoccaceae bacterium]|nr:MAG: hypothetical protein KatS3mg124_0782 [Porticoccaceae bacterium]
MSGRWGWRAARLLGHGKRAAAHAKALLRHPLAYASAVAHDPQRWSREEDFAPDWEERTRLLAQPIPPGARVIEFGAGLLALPRWLPSGCLYQPADLFPRSPETWVVDLNAARLPDPPGSYDWAVFSGVLEYVRDLGRLFGWLARFVDRVAFSYAALDFLSCPVTRRRNGWVNHYTLAELTALLERQDWQANCFGCWREQVLAQAGRQPGGPAG